MCGIAGRINFDSSNLIDETELRRMTNSIIHRGPDDEGFYINANIGLGFRRLSIIDLNTGHQPLTDSNNDVWITFNGEIYNYQSLRADLIKRGYSFRTETDTEVILNLYLHYGEKCLSHLRGMFAFVIWDNRLKQLFGARDHFGIKPFYYYLDNNSFIWSSELKAINQAEGVVKSLSLEALDSYFTYGYILQDQSIFSQIKKLKPAHYFILRPFDANKLTIDKYWDIEFDPDYSKSEEYWAQSIQEALHESVKLQMISDVPLGAFLSGGIDSSSVVALMAKSTNRPVKTFSIGFKEKEFNELELARLVAKKYNTEHHELIVEPESITLLEKLVRAFDEPFADNSAIPTYYVSKFAREKVTVALSGDGGDEMYAGYNSYSKMMALRNNAVFRSWPSRKLAYLIHKLIPDFFYGKGFTYYLNRNDDNIAAYFCLWKDYERKELYSSELLEQLKRNPSEEKIIELVGTYKGDFLSRSQRYHMETYMVDDILTKVDRVSMQNSLEVRVPIIDHKFAELSFKIPSELKLKGGEKKYILRKSMSDLLPAQILSGKKMGFTAPLQNWFKDELKDYLNDTVFLSKSLGSYINLKAFYKTFNNHQKGMRDFSDKLWSILFFNEWLKQNKI